MDTYEAQYQAIAKILRTPQGMLVTVRCRNVMDDLDTLLERVMVLEAIVNKQDSVIRNAVQVKPERGEMR